MALSNSYACFCAARVFAGLSSSWSQTVPPATVADMTIPSKRGDKMSLYGTAVVIAPAMAPLFCGLIIVSCLSRCPGLLCRPRRERVIARKRAQVPLS